MVYTALEKQRSGGTDKEFVANAVWCGRAGEKVSLGA